MTEKNKRRFKTTIANKEYTLVGDGSIEHMQAVSDLLNEQLTELQKQMPQSTEEQKAILIAFNAISNQLKMEEENSRINTSKRHSRHIVNPR